MEPSKVVTVLGAGPGLGAAIARRFVREGYAVALLARNLDSLITIHQQIAQTGGRVAAFPADATDASALSEAFNEIRGRLGVPEVFVYNAGSFHQGSVLEVTPEQFEESWRVNCLGAFLGVQQVLPGMLSRSRGTILFTGATGSRRGAAGCSCLSVGKFGLRALAESLAREVGPKGIHVAHIVIDGQVYVPRARAMPEQRPTHTMLDPDAIARTYWDIHNQAPTAWTFELELRPAVERF